VNDRDRDTAGRARNARPRDEAGRPLPHGSGGVDRIPDDLVLPPAQTLAEAQRLLDADRPFLAHEVLEAAWKNGPASERALWQGLAQLAVGLTHAQRGNRTGAVTLLRRGADRIAPYADAAPYQIAVRRLIEEAAVLAGRIESGGTESVSAPDRRLRLCSSASAEPEAR
jgi:hypothetical protein